MQYLQIKIVRDKALFMLTLAELKIAIIGLGYVGLPLAVEFGKKVSVVGFDIHQKRVDELKSGQDHTLEVSPEELKQASHLSYTADLDDLKDCNFFIVTVPTPIDDYKQPDLTPLIKASTSIGKVLKKRDIVVYESTVYPGATEEACIPVLEQVSGLKFNQDFFAGYSPERINPGDKLHRVTNILKITSGSTPEIAEFVDQVYNLVIEAGTHKAPSIKVAEAAKVIENTQRDVNIALINELAVIFNKMGIDTEAVLEAAGTKWNFLPFRPGLVGGHCIGVDPYYLTHKAQAIGYHPEIILAGRRLNDNMGAYVVTQLVKGMIKKKIQVEGAKVLILGLSFKENCPDIRNTKIIDIVAELKEYETQVDVYDPWVDQAEAEHEYGITPVQSVEKNTYDAVILAVAHEQFKEMGATAIRALGKTNHVLYDLKYVLSQAESDIRL
ncbi:nucleotide sugar dehydrogenase [Acinetobacter haemolyticus ATCC 19194]|uniref:Nucleotide sugar dehydrogenase n=2 Tax=Acinetobacter haemolyticus TaxID=29430 RepID=D4XL58_ACIHA|nr:nucleotide sugar dehydrogenase [Acinetobacter haemolyticus ATCC 19194]